ncbi:hypothetical protein [Hyphomicrobium facile]|uniref:Uncharacterized protein n=1 Tax=Hyphomicrobium facile TaxID=51670 RepID=A0A1I7NT55_9HYPH|nr:hypothetical protein [Hyphomicrobium facile]SFV37790.1 hypothetical protein SAMN04488557_3340 [Hyphomicrobium facile]
MLRFLSTIARVVFGFVLASLAAGLVTVMFVTTPIDVLTEPIERLPKTASETIELGLLAATHLGIFASVFVLIIAILSESFSVRSLTFYLFAGVAISMLGFVAQYASEVVGQPTTILNNYAVKAFLTIGFFGGFFYWLAAGQFAGRPHGEHRARTASVPQTADVTVSAPSEAAPRAENNAENNNDDAEVVITRSPTVDEQTRGQRPMMQRLTLSKTRSARQRSDHAATGSANESEDEMTDNDGNLTPNGRDKSQTLH